VRSISSPVAASRSVVPVLRADPADITPAALLDIAERMGGVLAGRRLTITNPSTIFAF
jgi:hypothetical protein